MKDIVQSALNNLLKARTKIKYGTIGVEFVFHNGQIRKINYSTTDKFQEDIV